MLGSFIHRVKIDGARPVAVSLTFVVNRGDREGHFIIKDIQSKSISWIPSGVDGQVWYVSEDVVDVQIRLIPVVLAHRLIRVFFTLVPVLFVAIISIGFLASGNFLLGIVIPAVTLSLWFGSLYAALKMITKQQARFLAIAAHQRITDMNRYYAE